MDIDISNNRRQWVTFFTHLILILIIFFLPEMMANYGRPRHGGGWAWYVYLKSAMYVGMFYLNYYVIVPRSIFAGKRRIWAFVAYNLMFIVLVFFILYMVQRNLLDFGSYNWRRRELPAHVLLMREWSFYLRDLVMMILAIALALIMKFTENWTSMEKKHEQVLAEQREDELRSLKSQINPHFLFNTLNTIYSLIDISPKEAQDAVHKLSKLLRYVLYENPQTVLLSQEVDFAKTYISLMEMRLGPESVKADFSHLSDIDYNVPPLIFISIIENAFKHGNTGNRREPIEITLTSDDSGVVTLRTFNHYLPDRDTPSKGHSGIGLANLQRRLHLIYGDNATLSTAIKDNTYTSILTIRLSPDK